MAYHELYHHGILGQKWGVRRYQNKDGTLTAKGRARKNSKTEEPTEKKGLSDRQKKALKIGAIAVGTALAAYGAKKTYDYVKSENSRILNEQGEKAARKILSNGISSVSLSSLKNGTYSLSYTRNGKRHNDYYGPEDKKMANEMYEILRDDSHDNNRRAANIRADYANKALNSNFRDSVKTVAKDKANRAVGSTAYSINKMRDRVATSQVDRIPIDRTPINRTPINRTTVRRSDPYSQRDYDALQRKKLRDLGL